MIDESIRPENVEFEMLVRVWLIFAIPLFADGSRVTVCVEQKSVVG